MNLETTLLPAADLNHVLTHTRDLWSRLRGETVFITGGTGTVGRWLLESFTHINHALQLQARAVVLTRSPEQFAACAPHLAADPAVQLIRGGVRNFDPDDLAGATAECASGRIPFVIHAATATGPPYTTGMPFRVLDTLYSGTRRVLEWAVTQSAARVLLLSSIAVYDAPRNQALPISEEFAGAPACDSAENALAEGQRVMELLGAIFREQYGLDCKTARCFTCLGPGMALRGHHPVGGFIYDALSGSAVHVPGDGTTMGSYLYLADLAIWLWTILLRDSASTVFNVGSDEAFSLRTVAERVAALGPHRVPLFLTGRSAPPAVYHDSVPDIARARRELGLEVWTRFESAVRKTFEYEEAWLKDQPAEAAVA